MTRLRGWAPKGERLVDKVPQGKWKTATFLAALRNDRIDAPCLFDGRINGERFRAYVEQFLVPTLKPGDALLTQGFREGERATGTRNGVARNPEKTRAQKAAAALGATIDRPFVTIGCRRAGLSRRGHFRIRACA